MSLLQNLKHSRNSLLFMGLIAFLSGFMPGVSGANTTPGSVTVAWNRNAESSVTGYKVYWGKNSRIYEQVLNTGNTAQAVLPNLTPGIPYFCAVTAYNTEGQESAFSSEILVVYGTPSVNPDTSGRLVMLEAESGQLGVPMAVFNGTTEAWVDTSYYSQLGWTQLTFEAPTSGDYHVWCRVKAPTESKDSFFVMADGGVEEVFHVYGTTTPPEGSRTNYWVWRRIHVTDAGPRPYAFDEGTHTLRFRVREPGTLLDRVVLSSDPAFVPSDSLPSSGDAVVVTGISGNQSASAGSSVTLAVTAAASGPVSYQWFKGGVAIPDSNSPMLALDNLSAGDSGNYSVLLTRGTASTTGGPVVLTVSDSAATPVFRVTRVTMNPGRTVSFELDGGLSSNIEILASSDMVNWEVIGVQINDTGVVEVEDPEAVGGATKRFYRLVSDAP